MGTISTETQQLAEAVRLACIELRTKINGNDPTLNALNTTAKGSLVAAINEVLALAGSGGSGAWDDITGKPAAVTALSGTNTGDQDLSGLLTIATAASTYAPISTTVTLAGTQTITGFKTFSNLFAAFPEFTGETAMENMLVDVDASFGQFGTVAFNGTTYTYGTGSALAHRTALGLGALATVSPGTNVATALAINADATGGIFRQGQALSGTTGTFSGAVSALRHNAATYGDVNGVAFTSVYGVVRYTGGGTNRFYFGLSDDTTIRRSSAGVLDIDSGTNDAFRDLRLRNLTASGTVTGSNLISSTVGSGLQVKGGSALARAGNATLGAGGTVTINNTTVTANTVIILTRKTSGGTIGMAVTYTVSAGASFTITSDSALDTSTYSFLLIEVNP